MSYKYGLLKSSGSNLGDDIQSVVIKSMLPNVDFYLDYDFLGDAKLDTEVKLIVHGCCRPKKWPPALAIKPLFVSFSIGDTAVKKLTSEASIRYLKRHEPIGCRDMVTLKLLKENGVEAYFSGCVTFMLGNNLNRRRDGVVIADLDDEAMRYIPSGLLKGAIILHHGEGIPIERIANRLYRYSPVLHGILKVSRLHMALSNLQQKFVMARENEQIILQRLGRAEELINKYANAKLVVTSRLHAALPCIALGTPVIFVHRDLSDPRFAGILDYMRAYTVGQFKRVGWGIDLDNPEPNPRSIEELRNGLLQRCREFIKGG